VKVFADPQSNALLIATVVVFVMFFDLIDLRPQIGSFRFVFSMDYLIYLGIRALLSFVSALVIVTTQPPHPPILVGLVAALSGILVLQNFTLNIAGGSVVDVTTLLTGYKARMSSDAAKHMADKLDAETIRLAEELVACAPNTAALRESYETVVYNSMMASGVQDPVAQAKGALALIDQQVESRSRARYFAVAITRANRRYARELLQRWWDARSLSAPAP